MAEDERPNGRVTNRDLRGDLLAFMGAVNTRLDAQTARIDAQTAHFDAGLAQVNRCLENLRETVNDQMHGPNGFEARVDKLERGFSLKTALLQGSWKLTSAMLMLAGALGGVAGRYGLPWQWGH